MRRLTFLAAILLAVAAPNVALSAPKSNKPARGTYLRYDPVPPPAPARPTTPVPTGRLALGGGLTGLSGLPPVGDAAGQCRARCARERYACEGGGEDCAPVWAACLRPCGAALGR